LVSNGCNLSVGDQLRIAATAPASASGSMTGNEHRSPTHTKAAPWGAAAIFSRAGCDAGNASAVGARSTMRSRNWSLSAAATSASAPGSRHDDLGFAPVEPYYDNPLPASCTPRWSRRVGSSDNLYSRKHFIGRFNAHLACIKHQLPRRRRMHPAVWRVLITAPLIGSVGLMIVRPFLAPAHHSYVVLAATMLLVLTGVIAALRHRLTFGIWARPVSTRQRQEIQRRVSRDSNFSVLMFLVLLPGVFVLHALGFGKGAVVAASLTAGAVVVVAQFVLRRKSSAT
jgi:hypothetical protein